MWLPTPVYERLPQFWLLLGLLFMSSGVYLGFDYRLSFAYFFIGALCVAWSFWTLILRHRHRSKNSVGAASVAADGVPGQEDSEQAVD